MVHQAVGERVFGDGQRRSVYLDERGRQYVVDANGRCVYGVWLVNAPEDADVPVVVDGGHVGAA